MSGRFLNDRDLGRAITKLMRGSDLRCAVAFWGIGATDRLFPSRAVGDARIVCELSIGSTHPEELRAMGAPENRRLKHLEQLHAKVYISDQGAIVCSANASDNGIGFVDVAGLVEAGVLIEPGTHSFQQVETWFEGIWKRSGNVDKAALKRATEAWNRRRRTPNVKKALPIPMDAPSLLGTVVADPERFRGIGFVFTTGAAEKKDRDEAANEVVRLDDERDVALLTQEERQSLREWNVGDLFTGWTEQDLDAWPRRFVCIHRPGSRASYWFYQRVDQVLLDEDRGVVFAERPKGLRVTLGFKHGSDAMLKNDAPLLDRIFRHCEEYGHWLCENGERLVRLMGDVGIADNP